MSLVYMCVKVDVHIFANIAELLSYGSLTGNFFNVPEIISELVKVF